MQPDSLALILQSIERPTGLMEIYRDFEINDRHNSRLPLLETCAELAKGYNEYGLALKYGIHNADIGLQLILTHQRPEYPIVQVDRDILRPLRS